MTAIATRPPARAPSWAHAPSSLFQSESGFSFVDGDGDAQRDGAARRTSVKARRQSWAEAQQAQSQKVSVSLQRITGHDAPASGGAAGRPRGEDASLGRAPTARVDALAAEPRAADDLSERATAWHALHDQRMGALESQVERLGRDVRRLAAAVEAGRGARAADADATPGPASATSSADWQRSETTSAP